MVLVKPWPIFPWHPSTMLYSTLHELATLRMALVESSCCYEKKFTSQINFPPHADTNIPTRRIKLHACMIYIYERRVQANNIAWLGTISTLCLPGTQGHHFVGLLFFTCSRQRQLMFFPRLQARMALFLWRCWNYETSFYFICMQVKELASKKIQCTIW